MSQEQKTYTLKTSGSTGLPKTITVNENYIKESALRTLQYLGITDGIVLNCLSKEHVGGFMQTQRALAGNLDLIELKPAKDPFRGKEIPWDHVSLLSLVPYQLNYLLDFYADNIALCKNILLGGAPVSEQLKEKIKSYGLANCYETYGMTETLSHIALKKLLKDQTFHALEGVSFRIDNRACLVVTDTKLEIAELVTNDIVKLESNKSFIWLGRADNIINSGGLKHLTEQLEQKIEKLSPDNRILVYSKRDDQLGETIHLAVESEVEIEDFKLKSFYKAVLTKYEVPKSVTFVPKFEETRTQKILREKTKDVLNAYKAYSIS